MEHINNETLKKEVGLLRKKLEYIETLLSCSAPLTSSKKRLGNSKCHSHYNKSHLAQLFYILLDEAILFFDEYDERANRSRMQEFLKTHFTFSGDCGLQTTIREISKQFSEAKGYTYRESQLLFIDKLLALLQHRRERIAKK